MPFEALNVDITVPENRDAFVESYAFFRSHGSDYSDAYDEPGMYGRWIKDFPEEAADFLGFCTTHEDPEVRRFAAILSVDFFETDPELAVNVIENAMKDEDPIVSENVTGYIFDILRDADHHDLLQTIGLLRTARLIKSYKKATATADN